MMGSFQNIFAIIPIAVLSDKCLKANDIRVYGAIASFQGRKGNCFPSQRKIQERSGVHVSHISKYTRRLEKLGYIEVIRRGKRISNVYKILGTGGEANNMSTSECAASAAGEQATPAGGEYAESAQSNIKRTIKITPTTSPGDEVLLKNQFYEVTMRDAARLKRAYPKIKSFRQEIERISNVLEEIQRKGERISSPMAFLHVHLKRENEKMEIKLEGRVRQGPSLREGPSKEPQELRLIIQRIQDRQAGA